MHILFHSLPAEMISLYVGFILKYSLILYDIHKLLLIPANNKEWIISYSFTELSILLSKECDFRFDYFCILFSPFSWYFFQFYKQTKKQFLDSVSYFDPRKSCWINLNLWPP